MKTSTEQWLRNRLEDRKEQLRTIAGIDGRTYRHWDPDLEYAEYEIIEGLIDTGEYEDWTEYDEASVTKLWQDTVFVQAVANMAGL